MIVDSREVHKCQDDNVDLSTNRHHDVAIVDIEDSPEHLCNLSNDAFDLITRCSRVDNIVCDNDTKHYLVRIHMTISGISKREIVSKIVTHTSRDHKHDRDSACSTPSNATRQRRLAIAGDDHLKKRANQDRRSCPSLRSHCFNSNHRVRNSVRHCHVVSLPCNRHVRTHVGESRSP